MTDLERQSAPRRVVLSGRVGGRRCRSQLQGQEAIYCGRPGATAQMQRMSQHTSAKVGIGCVSSETYL